ncbi:hypothetical protein N7456_013262 [Penicillium angulare]|uniref:Uncharacterized protein n=1 Tax=Penicillium angulare TaxID=116970 RepID=A0A9W9JWB1_9EURO|nr:hypothetical protein N7456_013262 [Penicillium angulare]
MQDELAALFDQQMAIESRPEPQGPSYSISQHYNHSSHVVPPPNPPAEIPTPSSPIDTLWQYGIDPSTLLPRQLDLFVHADAEQQQRLVQTWQVYARSAGVLVGNDLTMQDSKEEPEPYMASGYETASSRSEPITGQRYTSATDPVYKSQHWWEMAQTGPMESQYGAFQERSRYDMNGGAARTSLFH